MDEYESGFQEFAGLVETALSLRLSAIGQRNRRRTLEAFNTCRDTLLSLVHVHRQNAYILEDFREYRIVPLKFGEHVSRRFQDRVLEMRAAADVFYKQVIELEAAIEMMEVRFDQDEPATEGNWFPVKVLSDRSANTAHLWVDVDPISMKIKDRVVRKDTAFAKSDLKDGTRWMSEGSIPRVGRPMEYHLQRKLNDLPGSRCIAEARKCEVDMQRFVYRLYLTYYQYGDLAGLIERYMTENVLIPEPFLWRVFEALVETGLLMEQGGVKMGHASWEEIVHRDLKPVGVVLSRKL